MRRRSGAVAALAVVVGATSACGVPVDQRATTADREDVPFGLLDEPATEAPPTSQDTTADVYLVSSEEGLLAPVPRPVGRGGLDGVVDALERGATSQEQDAGLRSDVPANAVADVTLTGGVATVDLTEGFTDLDGASQRTAIAQIVYTLTARPGVGRVSFTLDGGPVEIPRGDGTLTSGSVSRDTYRELIDAG